MKASQARVVLTGASGGIGQAAALALAQAGASMLLSGRSPARLCAQARALQQRMPQVQVDWHEVDLQRMDSIASLAKQAAEWRCNVLIHCAGVAEFGRFDHSTPDRMAAILHTNLLAPMVLTQALLPHLRSLPQAQVICVGSVLGAMGLPGFSVYCASKFGLRGFAQALRRELADTAVRVQFLGPRSTRTPFNTAEVSDYNQATRTAMDTPEVVAQALLKMLQTGSAERFLGFPEKLGVRLNGLMPSLLEGAFKKHRASLPIPLMTPSPSTHKELKNAN